MRYEIVHNPVGMVDMFLDWGDEVIAESAALVYTRGDVAVHTGIRSGGLLKTLKTTVLAKESFFVNKYVAQEDGCSLGLTGNVLGDIAAISVTDDYIIQAGAFVASIGKVTLDTKWQGLARGVFGQDIFMLKTIGSGTVFVNGWGGIRTMSLNGSMIMDNRQLVALSPGISYKVVKHSSWKTTILGGEGFVLKLDGQGSVVYQTKNPAEFASALSPFLPKR